MKKKKVVSALTVLAVAALQIPAAFSATYENPDVESIFFVDESGSTLLEPDGEAIPYVVISRTESGEKMEGAALVAVYDNSGALYSAQVINVNETNSVYGEKATQIERWTLGGEPMEYPKGGYAKAFWWDSADTMKPYAEASDDILAPDSSYIGDIVLPDPFNSLLGGASITKEAGVRNYSHTASPDSVYDWSEATQVFISYNGAQSGLGDSTGSAITMQQFVNSFNAGAYGDEKDFIFTITDDIYSGDETDAILIGTNCALGESSANLNASINALIKSGSASGFTWIGQESQNPSVSAEQGIYKAILSGKMNVIPVNLSATDAYGMPRSYNLAASLEECIQNKGTYYQAEESNEVYFNPFEGENFSDIKFFELAPKVRTGDGYIGSLVFENIGFMPNALNNGGNSINGGDFDKTRFGFFGCKFYRGASNALNLSGKYTAFVFDCVNAYGARDGFNYHADNDAANEKYSTAIEVNSISYKHGSFNQLQGAEKDTNSNNASTGHDGMNILRVGGRYWQTEGPIVADGTCFTVNIGCEAYNFVTTSPSERTSFLGHNNEANAVRGGKLPNKYYIDCLGTGVKIRAGIVSSENTYVLDFKGNERLALDNSGNENPLRTITWDEIAAGGITMYEKTIDTGEIFKSSDAYLSGVQGTNGWNFQFASINGDNYTDYNVFNNGWFYEYYGNIAYGLVNGEDRMQPGNDVDVVKTYTCPQDGMLELSSDVAIELARAGGDGVNIKILKNDEQVWPAQGWQLIQSGDKFEFTPVKVKVARDDKLHFRVNKNLNTSNDALLWSPTVQYVEEVAKSIEISGQKTNYYVGEPIDREQGIITVTYADESTAEIPFSNEDVEISGFDTSSKGTKIVTVAYKGAQTEYNIRVESAPLQDEYSIVNDISDAQGKSSWYYKYALLGEYGTESYKHMSYGKDGVWLVSEGDWKYGRIRMNAAGRDISTGNLGDPALVFKAPVSGEINLSMLDGKISEVSSSDITRFKIYKNDEQIYPVDTSKEWLVLVAPDGVRKVNDVNIDYNDEFGTDYPNAVEFNPMLIEVAEGDEIIFRVNKGSEEGANVYGAMNDGDKLVMLPVIKYTRVDEESNIAGIELSGAKTEYNRGDRMDKTQGNLIVTYNDETTETVSLEDPVINISGFNTDTAGEKTITVTYKNVSTTFVITVYEDMSKTIFNIYDDITDTQGKNAWYYKYAPFKKYELSDYLEYGYYDRSVRSAWQYAKDNFMYGRVRMVPDNRVLEPGYGGDAALVFNVPATGKIKLSMYNETNGVAKITATGTADTVRLRIYKNEEQIYPAQEGEWQEFTAGQTVDFIPMVLDVNYDDQIIFRVNKGSEVSNTEDPTHTEAGDKIECVPMISYIN